MMADLSGRPRSFESSSNAFFAVAERARRTSDKRLVVAEASGFAVAIAVFAFEPESWSLALPAVSVGALGMWGITDHMLDARPGRLVAPLRWTLSIFRFAIATIAIVAAIAAGYSLVGKLMGVM